MCGACVDGKYTAAPNWTECVSWSTCLPGQRFAQAGDAAHDVVCEYCLEGTYSPGGEATQCSSCPSGTTSFNGSGCCFAAASSSEQGPAPDAGVDGGSVTTAASEAGASDGVCSDPITVKALATCGRLIIDEADDLYLLDTGPGTRVTKLSLGGETIWQWEDSRTASLEYGADKQLYLLDMQSTQLSVSRLLPDGVEQHLWEVEELPSVQDVSVGPDGAFYVTGSRELDTGGRIGHVTRVDAEGSVDWTVDLTPPDPFWLGGWFNTLPMSVVTDAEGGVYVSAVRRSPAFDALGLEITKLGPTGQVQWLRQWDLPESSSGGGALLSTRDSVVIEYDYSASFFVGSKVQRIASVGSFSFDGSAKPLGGGGFQANIEVPFDGFEEFRANSWWSGMAAGTDGTLAITGRTDGYFDAPSAGGVDWFLGVFSPNGEFVRRQFGTPGTDSVCGVAVDSQGNVFVAGRPPEGVSFAGLTAGTPYLLRYPASKP